jgi:hypothetical protein
VRLLGIGTDTTAEGQPQVYVVLEYMSRSVVERRANRRQCDVDIFPSASQSTRKGRAFRFLIPTLRYHSQGQPALCGAQADVQPPHESVQLLRRAAVVPAHCARAQVPAQVQASGEFLKAL